MWTTFEHQFFPWTLTPQTSGYEANFTGCWWRPKMSWFLLVDADLQPPILQPWPVYSPWCTYVQSDTDVSQFVPGSQDGHYHHCTSNHHHLSRQIVIIETFVTKIRCNVPLHTGSETYVDIESGCEWISLCLKDSWHHWLVRNNTNRLDISRWKMKWSGLEWNRPLHGALLSLTSLLLTSKLKKVSIKLTSFLSGITSAVQSSLVWFWDQLSSKHYRYRN